MPWVLLIAAGILEAAWAVGLKYTNGFTRPLPSILTIVGIVASLYLLSIAARTLPIGTAYPIWVGIGALGAAAGGVVLFGEAVSVTRVVCLLGLVASIVGLKLTA